MSTGTIQAAAAQTITDMTSDGALQLTFENDSGAELFAGQEVTLKTTDKLDERNAGTELPVGIVVKGGADAARVTVRTFFTAVITGVATGGTLNSGTFVRPNGTLNANNQPQYVACIAGDYSVAQVIKGGAAAALIVIGIQQGVTEINA